ncbi:MAG: DUF4982 domain-containing protein [Bacteroidales bacterium]|nr:DUF4982 domain-containing protein [Bacteroidales bacterium]
MKKSCFFAAFFAALLSMASCSSGAGDGSRVLFNDAWSFSLDGAEPLTVNLPHDWGVEGEFVQEYPGESGKLRWWGRAEYRKTLDVKPEDLKGQVFLEIDGAMSHSRVMVNGQDCGGWPYGYASYAVELTPALHEGSNEIVIALDNPEESSRWYPGGGIYRNVWLTKRSVVHVDHWGTVVTSAIAGSEAAVQLRIRIRNAGEPVCAKVETKIFKADGSVPVPPAVTVIDSLADGMEIIQEFSVPEAEFWTPDSPQMYLAETTIFTEGNRSDKYCTPFGIRSAECRADGFWLNGEKTFLKGVCLHHDAGALGAAWNEDAWVRRLLKLKELGCNAIRMSHNPPAPELLDLCDKMGFLVIDELTDTWTVPKKPNGYATLFDEWVEKDLVAMIHRDRNHPSVIMWSIGNEVGEQGIAEKWSIASRLTDICHREDPTRPSTAGNDNLWAASQPYATTIDVYGFNYKPHAYEGFRGSHPGKPFYGSETASCISTRGYYLFPVIDEKGKGWLDGKPYQVSSYDLYAPAWASKPDYEWFYEDQVPECMGEFVWTGYDYLGEPTPYNLDPSVLTNFHTEEEKRAAIALFASWGQKVLMEPLPSRSSYFGIMDLAGFPKDRFWLYQARWRPELQMAHLLPHWTWPGREGETTPVHVYTSGSVAELFINGKSQGIRKKSLLEYRLRWDDAVYEPGTVEVKVYKDMDAYKAGEIWAVDKVCTAGAPERVELGVDYAGKDLVFITASVLDAAGNLVPNASDRISFTVDGKAEILATDAGDPTSHQAFGLHEINAFNGLASVIVRRDGKFTLRAESAGLASASLQLATAQ